MTLQHDKQGSHIIARLGNNPFNYKCMAKQKHKLSINYINKTLTDTVVWSSSMFVVFALIGSLSRIPNLGFMPVMYFHIAICTAFASVYLFKAKLSTSFKAHFVCYTFFIVGVVGVHTFGISASGLFFIFSSAIISSLIINLRTAVVLASLGLLSLIIYFYLFKFVGFEFRVAQGEYNESASAWILIISVYVYVSAISLFLIHRFFTYLKQLLANQQDDLKAQADQLDYTNIVMRTIIDSLPFDILWKDTSLVYVSANEKFVKNVGIKQGIKSHVELKGKTDSDFFDEMVTAYNKDIELGLLSGERQDYLYEQSTPKSDGSLTYQEVQKIALKDSMKEIIGVLVVINDITHLKTLELQAQAASELKSKFLASMSHEIRTPLNGILGLLDLSVTSNDAAKKEAYLEKAVKSATLLKQLVNNVLDLSKIETNQLHLESIPLNLHELLAQVTSLLEDQAQQKGLELNSSFVGDNTVNLTGDPTRVLQIMINLIANAIKFTPSGQVTVKLTQVTSDNQAKVRLTVADSGIGISESNLALVFENFTQAEDSITRRFGGTGLGLAIVKSLTEQMLGNIKVKSELGQGSVFTVELYFPISVIQSKVFKAESNLSGHRNNALRILLVEDNEINQEIAREMLLQAGCSIIVANNGQEAIDIMQDQAFDFIFMDIQMPIMDGVTAVKIIRQNERWKEIPIVALTANVMSSEVKEYLRSGFTAHIGKPYSRDTLLSCISAYVT